MDLHRLGGAALQLDDRARSQFHHLAHGHLDAADFDGAALVIGPDGAGLTSEEVYGALSAYVTALRERNAVPKDDAAS